jgi:hypothetical protein
VGGGVGGEASKKARSTVKKAAGRAKKAATAEKTEPAGKKAAPTKSAAKTAKATKAAKAATGTAKAAAEPAKGTGKPAKAAAKAAKTTKGTASKRGGATEPADVDHDEGGGPPVAGKRPGRRARKSAARAEMAQPGTQDEAPLPALNEPMTFLTFVANHPIGSTFKGTVSAFTSHGAHIDIDGMKAHVPLSLLGRPAPGKARDVLSKGETRDFVLVSLDAPRRRAEVALPEFAPDK